MSTVAVCTCWSYRHRPGVNWSPSRILPVVAVLSILYLFVWEAGRGSHHTGRCHQTEKCSVTGKHPAPGGGRTSLTNHVNNQRQGIVEQLDLRTDMFATCTVRPNWHILDFLGQVVNRVGSVVIVIKFCADETHIRHEGSIRCHNVRVTKLITQYFTHSFCLSVIRICPSALLTPPSNVTLKCHIILEHYNTYFTRTGKTLRHTNGEFVESCHSQLRKSEERHQFKRVKGLGTPSHQASSNKSLTVYNSTRAFSPSSATIQKKKSSPHTPSPLSFSPSPHSSFPSSTI